MEEHYNRSIKTKGEREQHLRTSVFDGFRFGFKPSPVTVATTLRALVDFVFTAQETLGVVTVLAGAQAFNSIFIEYID